MTLTDPVDALPAARAGRQLVEQLRTLLASHGIIPGNLPFPDAPDQAARMLLSALSAHLEAQPGPVGVDPHADAAALEALAALCGASVDDLAVAALETTAAAAQLEQALGDMTAGIFSGRMTSPTPAYLAEEAVRRGLAPTSANARALVELLILSGRAEAFDVDGVGPFLCLPGQRPADTAPHLEVDPQVLADVEAARQVAITLRSEGEGDARPSPPPPPPPAPPEDAARPAGATFTDLELAAFLELIGWTRPDGRLRCKGCTAGTSPATQAGTAAR